MLKKNIITSLLLILYVLVLPSTVVSQVADSPWPMFHYDIQHRGKTSNFGTQYGKLKWRYSTRGPITSSPIIDNNGIVYIGSADNYFYAIDTETGVLQWKYQTGAAIELSTPALDENGIIYVGCNDGKLYAFDTNNIADPDNVQPDWTFQTGGAISSSPSIDVDGTIIFSSNDGFLYAVNPNGTAKWANPPYIGSSWCSPTIDTNHLDSSVADRMVYIGSFKPQESLVNLYVYQYAWSSSYYYDPGRPRYQPAQVNFFAIDADTGQIVWDFPGDPYDFCTPGGILSSPVLSPDHSIIVSFLMSADNQLPCDFTLYDYNIFNLPPVNAAQLSAMQEAPPHYFDNGSLEYQHDYYEPTWRLELINGADIYSTPAMIEDSSIFVGVGNTMMRLLPDFTSYFELLTVGERIESSPSIDGRKFIFFGSNGGKFYCISADAPEAPLVWEYPDGTVTLKNADGSTASLISSPAIGDDDHHSVYVGATDGFLYAFYDGPRISGTIVDAFSVPSRDIPVALKNVLTGEIEQTAYTDTNGYYEFNSLENGTYTITPSKLGFAFSPESEAVVVSNDNDVPDIDFIISQDVGFAISGTIRNIAGTAGIPDVRIILAGEDLVESVTVFSNASGYYEFTGLSFGTFTITPYLSGYNFTPQKNTVIISPEDAEPNKSNIDFSASIGSAAPLLSDSPWPMFHHDVSHTGKSTNFGTQVGKLKWSFVTNGPVTSSPAIDNYGTLYIGSADKNFYAINTETGALEWKYTTDESIELCSPAIDINDVVYIGSNDGTMYAFDITTIDPLNPEPKWTYQTNGAISSSPAIDVDGAIVFASNDGYIYSLNPSGSLKWRQWIGPSWSSPAIDPISGQVYIGAWKPQESVSGVSTIETVEGELIEIPLSVNFFALNSSTGEMTWEFPTFCIPGGILSSPVIGSDQSVIVSFFTTWAADCTDESSKFHIWSVEPNGQANWGLQLGALNDIYTTPAMLEDNSFFIASGALLYRITPDGQIYLSTEMDGERIESSPAIDGGKLVFVGSNGGRFYCLNADAPETPVLWQYPPEDEDPLQNSTGFIASIISSPAIGADERHSVYVGASDGRVYAFYDGPRIYGSIELVSEDGQTKTPLRAVKLTLTSEFSEDEMITYTDTNGDYEFAGVEDYTYTVTPEKIGYVFNPELATATIKQGQDAMINFEGFSGFSISGTVQDATGTALSGVTITLDGEKIVPTTTTSDANGQYAFSGLSFDSYTVTPSFSGYGFEPSEQVVTISSTDVQKDKVNIDFTATFGSQISGSVTDVRSTEGIQGVTINLTGAVSQSTTTDENGNYSFVGLTSGSYTVTPLLAGFDFNPESQTVTIAGNNVSSVNFVAGSGVSISGYILDQNSAPFTDVTVALYEYNFLNDYSTVEPISTVQTDSNGYFVFIGYDNGLYFIKPELEGYGFEPTSYTVTVAGQNITDRNFWAKPGLYISGKVTNLFGFPYAGIQVSYGVYTTTGETPSGSTTAATDENGQYIFTGLTAGTYAVMVQADGFSAAPEMQVIELTVSGKDNVDFTVSTVCPEVIINIPPLGNQGTVVNIFGNNFGWSKPDPAQLVTVGETGVTVEAGVYFGPSDPEEWIKADVVSWSNWKIVAEAPAGFGFYSVWVVSPSEDGTGCYYTTPSPLNFFVLY